MDPALLEALRRSSGDDILEAAALLRHGAPVPQEMRVVARFSDVVTCRIRADAVRSIRAHPSIVSLKAARAVHPAHAIATPEPDRAPRRRGIPGATGRGVLVAALDWGCDFAHPSFRRADGTTRLIAMWDQRGNEVVTKVEPYGYGRILSREAIDAALRSADPYAALGYHPAGGPSGGGGKHGTHVLDIAAGTHDGVAPEADLAFVHLASSTTADLNDLGDSVRILEALDFVRALAGDRPWVANLSLGRTGGDHSHNIVTRALDSLLEESPGRACSQSVGNYRDKRLHTQGVVSPGGTVDLSWVIPPHDPTTNELEIWYSGRDRLRLELIAPDGSARVAVPLGDHRPVMAADEVVGMAYHRAFDPLNGDHHIDLFLEPPAAAGTWTVRLTGEDVVDGRYHGWIERDSAVPRAQSRFASVDASPRSTIGTIATGQRALVVGAYDPRTREPASFSSEGPTRDGRRKPDLIGPGVGIRAARSTAGGEPPGTGGEISMSGTSMAAPHVAGAVALLFEKAPRNLNIAETRLLLLGTTDAAEGDAMRTGNGILNTEAALAAVQTLGRREAMKESDLLDGYLNDAIGPIANFEIIGRAGNPLSAALAPGDVLVRFDAGLPLVASVQDTDLVDAESASVDVVPAEDAGPGYYARTREVRAGNGVPVPLAYRRVLVGGSGVLAPRTLVARPRPSPLRPIQGPSRPLPPPEPAEPADPGVDEPAAPQPEPGQQVSGEPAQVTVESNETSTLPVCTVLDPEALVRSAPPELRPTGGRIPVYARVRVVETSGRHAHVVGEDGTEYGWTATANLGSFYKDLERLRTVALVPSSVLSLQQGMPLVRRAIVETYNRLGRLTGALAAELSIPLEAVLAVWQAESGGARHVRDHAIIRFENHLLFRRWGDAHGMDYDRHFQHGGRAGISGDPWEKHTFRNGEQETFKKFHGNQTLEYQVLRLATQLAGRDTAIQCISIGGPQILVSNYRLLGYGSAGEMYDAFQADERAHVLGFFDFCQYRLGYGNRRGELIRDLGAQRWEDFARAYNGSGQVAKYAADIRSGFDEARAVLGSSPDPSERVAEVPLDANGYADGELAGFHALPGNAAAA